MLASAVVPVRGNPVIDTGVDGWVAECRQLIAPFRARSLLRKQNVYTICSTHDQGFAVGYGKLGRNTGSIGFQQGQSRKNCSGRQKPPPAVLRPGRNRVLSPTGQETSISPALWSP